MTRTLSSEATLYKEIIEEAKKNKKLFFNESTVGTSLPIISTLKDLVRTKDKINRIEGIFSEILSYIFNEFSKSDIDNELDVARKVIILGRMTGINLSLDILPLENIFMVFAILKDSDNMIAFTTQRFSNPLIIQGARASSQVLTYLESLNIRYFSTQSNNYENTMLPSG
ncbi:11592_t:CDS:2, partial [Scutellospora calospora]